MKVGLESERLRARPRIADRRGGGLLHDVAECASELELAPAGHDTDLDLEHLATDRRVRQSRRHADLVVERHLVFIEGRRPEKRSELYNLHPLLGRLGTALGAVA